MANAKSTLQIRLYTHQLTDDQRVQLDRAVGIFHDAQQQVCLDVVGERALVVCGDSVSFERDILSQARAGNEREITATGMPLVDNWFTHTQDGRAVMTLTDWQVAFLEDLEEPDSGPNLAPPFPTAAPDAYLLQSLTLVTFLLVAEASDWDYLHEATTGCLADLCADKRTRAIKMRAGYVCPRCLAKASATGVSAVLLDAIRALAECVRALAIGRRPQPHSARSWEERDDDWIDSVAPEYEERLPKTLVAACAERRLSVVVGSGLSLQSDVEVVFPDGSEWARLPTWSETPFRLAAALKRYRDRDHTPRSTDDLRAFLADMDFFRSELGERAYYPRAIFDAFLPTVTSPGRANRLVFRLPVQSVMTTNYDLILNHAAPSGTATFTWKEATQAREYLERAKGALAPLVKVHGCASRPDTVVLTRSEYDALRADEPYLSMMRSVFDSKAVFFLGFGMNDPLDLDLAVEQAELAGAAQGEKFALLPSDRAAAVRNRFSALNVVACDDPDDVPALLAALIRTSARADR